MRFLGCTLFGSNFVYHYLQTNVNIEGLYDEVERLYLLGYLGRGASINKDLADATFYPCKNVGNM